MMTSARTPGFGSIARPMKPARCGWRQLDLGRSRSPLTQLSPLVPVEILRFALGLVKAPGELRVRSHRTAFSPSETGTRRGLTLLVLKTRPPNTGGFRSGWTRIRDLLHGKHEPCSPVAGRSLRTLACGAGQRGQLFRWRDNHPLRPRGAA